RAKSDAGDRALVAVEDGQFIPGLRIPDPYRPIGARRSERVVDGTERDAGHDPRGPSECVDFAASGRLPHSDDPVGAAGRHVSSVGAERHAPRGAAVLAQDATFWLPLQFPNADRALLTGRGQPRAVPIEAHAEDGA